MNNKEVIIDFILAQQIEDVKSELTKLHTELRGVL